MGAVELLVAAIGGEQLGMGAPLDDAAVLEHEQQVSGADRGQPVRDHDRRTPIQRLGERLLHRRLGGGVQVGGGLVQDDDPRARQQRPGDGQALPLPTRGGTRVRHVKK